MYSCVEYRLKLFEKFRYETRHEKTCLLNMQKQGADQLHGNHVADRAFVFAT